MRAARSTSPEAMDSSRVWALANSLVQGQWVYGQRSRVNLASEWLRKTPGSQDRAIYW